jgi:hypothetical protein
MTNANTDLPGSQIAFGGLFRRHCNPQQLLGFADQLCQLLVGFGTQFDCELTKSVPKQFEPEVCFVALFFNDAKLGHELNFGTRAESRTIVCGDRTAGAEQLITYMLSLEPARKASAESDNIQSKSSRSHLQLLAHSRSLPVACHLHQPIREQNSKDEVRRPKSTILQIRPSSFEWPHFGPRPSALPGSLRTLRKLCALCVGSSTFSVG